jgi:hypothetical protein
MVVDQTGSLDGPATEGRRRRTDDGRRRIRGAALAVLDQLGPGDRALVIRLPTPNERVTMTSDLLVVDGRDAPAIGRRLLEEGLSAEALARPCAHRLREHLREVSEGFEHKRRAWKEKVATMPPTTDGAGSAYLAAVSHLAELMAEDATGGERWLFLIGDLVEEGPGRRGLGDRVTPEPADQARFAGVQVRLVRPEYARWLGRTFDGPENDRAWQRYFAERAAASVKVIPVDAERLIPPAPSASKLLLLATANETNRP